MTAVIRNSLRKNVAFNYIGQLYSTLIGIVILPMFLKYIGSEAYGLVGFFTLIQAWMNLLDLGMLPTLGREVARLKNQPAEHWRLITVVNTLETLFIGLALFLGSALFISKQWIAEYWLTFDKLPQETVTTAVAIMAITVAVRWVSLINRSGINAFEAQVWMNLANIMINTLRYPGALALVVLLDNDVLNYFYFQLAVVLMEVAIIRSKLRSLLPTNRTGKIRRFSISELRRIAPFALGIGYTSAIWVLLTQLDKLLLSKILTLSEFGYFTLVATIATGITTLAGPVNNAILPRMTALLADNKEQEMLLIYRRSTRLVVSIIVPITLVIAALPEFVVYTWTGDHSAAGWTAPILPIFILGSGLLTVIAFQYYLQYAHGVLKYHVFYNTISAFINVPLITYTAFNYGVVGVAWVWLAFRVFSLMVWVPFIHHKLAPGLHFQWLLRDITPAVLSSVLIIFIINHFINIEMETSRLTQFGFLVATTTLAIVAALCISMQDIIRSKICGRSQTV